MLSVYFQSFYLFIATSVTVGSHTRDLQAICMLTCKFINSCFLMYQISALMD